jgi:mannose-6-phosphate isomerase-like protein (cupin superfamily)
MFASEQSPWIAVQPSSGESIPLLPFPNSMFKYKLRGDQTNGSFVLIEADYWTDGPGLHIHTRESELIHIIDGRVQFIVNGTQFCASTGDYVYVPRNVSQAVRIENTDQRSKPVRLQIQLNPAGLEHFLDEIAPYYYHGQNDTAQHGLIAEKYGIINLGLVAWKDLGCFAGRSNGARQFPSTFLHSIVVICILSYSMYSYL